MITELWKNSNDPHENMGKQLVEDSWRNLIHKEGPAYLLNILQCAKFYPSQEPVSMKSVKKMLALEDGARFYFSQGGALLCFFHATPFDRYPQLQPPSEFSEGAPWMVSTDNAMITFCFFLCWIMAKADPQFERIGIARYPEPYRQWAYTYLAGYLWMAGWVNKEAFIRWVWERGLLTHHPWWWDRWQKMDLEKSGILLIGDN